MTYSIIYDVQISLVMPNISKFKNRKYFFYTQIFLKSTTTPPKHFKDPFSLSSQSIEMSGLLNVLNLFFSVFLRGGGRNHSFPQF